MINKDYWLTKHKALLAAVCGSLCFAMTPLTTFAQVVASAPYTVSAFAQSVSGVYTKPDSIAVLGDHVFVGYGNGVAKDGTDGKSSTIVKYDMDGTVDNTFNVLGHIDGLKVEPKTSLLWSLQNEDANPTLIILNPISGTQTSYILPAPQGGGYDDLVFRNGQVFLTASNPSNNPNIAPAVVKAQVSGSSVVITPVLSGNSNAIDIPTGSQITLNLQDPDSMTLDPFGDLVLTSQADAELVVVHHPGFTDQRAFHLALTNSGAPTTVDDTVFATSSYGLVLVSDREGETVYSIQRAIFSPSDAYSASDGAGFVGRVDLDTGVLTPVVTGFVSPHGMAFVGR
ncbi:MAG: hypothetical protein NVS9B5_36880 [Terriglobales bacterium]